MAIFRGLRNGRNVNQRLLQCTDFLAPCLFRRRLITCVMPSACSWLNMPPRGDSTAEIYAVCDKEGNSAGRAGLEIISFLPELNPPVCPSKLSTYGRSFSRDFY